MERRSEIVEGLETLRERILGYDAAADQKGAAWDELRVELDKGVLALIAKAERLESYVEVPVWAKGAAAGLDLGAPGSEATVVKFVVGVDLAKEPDASVEVRQVPRDVEAAAEPGVIELRVVAPNDARVREVAGAIEAFKHAVNGPPGGKIACRKCRGLHVPEFDCSNSPGTGRGVRAG